MCEFLAGRIEGPARAGSECQRRPLRAPATSFLRLGELGAAVVGEGALFCRWCADTFYFLFLELLVLGGPPLVGLLTSMISCPFIRSSTSQDIRTLPSVLLLSFYLCRQF